MVSFSSRRILYSIAALCASHVFSSSFLSLLSLHYFHCINFTTLGYLLSVSAMGGYSFKSLVILLCLREQLNLFLSNFKNESHSAPEVQRQGFSASVNIRTGTSLWPFFCRGFLQRQSSEKIVCVAHDL